MPSAKLPLGLIVSAWVLLVPVGCGDNGTEAERRGVGSQCARDSDCTESGQRCLTQFKSGYCGVSACTSDASCPQGSACVRHDDGMNYCFLVCAVKADCNRNRSADAEANCSSTAMLVDMSKDRKVCTPPSGK